jgi:hypothetical protein
VAQGEGKQREHADAEHATQQVQRPADIQQRAEGAAPGDEGEHQRQRGQRAQRRHLHGG